jgi:carbon monoxide dehydrogenase subunit G
VELSNSFTVPAPIEETWSILTDLERIAPCMPGAQLLEVDGEEYRGTVKVKVGPITVEYKGSASFVELDGGSHTAVLRASGRDTRGQGNATALVTAQLTAEGEATAVTVTTDLDITGKVAQFGRGMLADVSTKLIGQFVTRLESDILSTAVPAATPPGRDAHPEARSEAAEPGFAASTTAETATAETPSASSNGTAGAAAAGPARGVVSAPSAPVDLWEVAGTPLLKRLLPLAAVVALLAWVLRRRTTR